MIFLWKGSIWNRTRFLRNYGNHWFNGNSEVLRPNDYHIIFLLEFCSLLSFKMKVLKIGASNGNRLARIHENRSWQVSSVDPFREAYNGCKKKYPFIEFTVATAKDINIVDAYEAVIVNSVLHRADRKNLFITVGKIDLSFKDGWALIMGDFQTPLPLKRKYHQLKDQEAFTYK